MPFCGGECDVGDFKTGGWISCGKLFGDRGTGWGGLWLIVPFRYLLTSGLLSDLMVL